MRPAIISSLLVVLSAGVIAQEQSPKPIDYETFCKLPDAGAKKAAFGTTTAENRGTLARTHLERWRDANHARLDDKQKTTLAELIKSITSESYGNTPQSEEVRVKSRAIISDVARLFTREDMMAMQFTEPCIPKK